MSVFRLFYLLLLGFAAPFAVPGLPLGLFHAFAYSHASYASYDGLGRKVRQTDEAGVSTGFTYDFRGLLTAVTLDLGQTDAQTTTYGYDEFGNEVSQTTPNSPNSQTTTYQYDALGRRSQRSLPGGQAETFDYDAVGNAVLHTNFNGVVLTNQYDALNRLTNTIQAGGGYQVSQIYTAAGMRQTLTDSTGTNTWIYNGLNRLITNTSPRGTLYYAYDVAGSVTNIWSGTVGGVNLQYCYDCLGRLTNTLANGTSVAVHGYDGVGNLAGTTLGNGVTNYYQYTAENRLVSLNWKHGSSARASFAYSLDLAGTRTNLSETVNGTAQSYGWSYDRFYRLTNEVIGSGTLAGTVAYALDAVGNRTNRTSSVAGVTNVTNTFTTNDWLTTAAYDANGNTLTNGSIVSLYDAMDRLTNCHTGSATVVLAYNGDGTRVSKTIGTTTTLYLVDDRNPSGYPQVLEESTVSGGSTTLSRIYMWGTSLINQKQASGGAVHYYGLDGHGSVRFLMDTSGNVTDTYTYDAFGLEVGETGTTVNNYLYSGEQYDPDLGMYYLRARYYKPDTGRFWSMDTYQGFKMAPSSLHKYVYCAANPMNITDPSGHDGDVATFDAVMTDSEIAEGTGLSVISASQQQAIRQIMQAAALIGATIGSQQENTSGRVIIGQAQIRVVQAAPEFRALPYSGSDDVSDMIIWVRACIAAKATFVDIGYDSDNLGEETKYDDEVIAMAGYPREKVLFRGSLWSPPAGKWAP